MNRNNHSIKCIYWPNRGFDPESTGYISTEKFRNLLQRHGSELDPHKLEVLLALADNNSDGKICYQDFVNLMSNKRSNSFRQAILQGNRRLCSKALLEESGLSLSQRLIRHVAYETLPREIDRKWYYDSYTCCPPPWFMIVAFFLYNGVVLDRFVLQVTHPLYLKNSLVYHPQLRAQAWRYLTYIFMHAGIEHLGLNVALQLLVGVPLEMVHGAARIGFVYIAGVIAGSLAVSVADMTAPVVGSSGGVYALISAHLANIVMNWSGMKCQFKLLRMALALICSKYCNTFGAHIIQFCLPLPFVVMLTPGGNLALSLGTSSRNSRQQKPDHSGMQNLDPNVKREHLKMYGSLFSSVWSMDIHEDLGARCFSLNTAIGNALIIIMHCTFTALSV
uniref:rhomboid protease n=1 Tax=Terrapene triunguis TaxID=2587831 RepID=A0A674IJI7_9SAUR